MNLAGKLLGALALVTASVSPAAHAESYLMKMHVPGLCADCAQSGPATLKPLPDGAAADWEPASPGSNLLVSGTRFVFATTAVGELSAELQAHLTVRTSRATRVTRVELVDGQEDFKVSTDCPASGIAPGTYCSVRMRLAPENLGNLTGRVMVTAEDDASPIELLLSGASFNREPGIAHHSGSTSFGTVRTDRGLVRDFVFRNTGDGVLKVTGAQMEGSDASHFTVLSNTCETVSWVATRNTCTISVRFMPREERLHQATLSLNTNVAANGGVVLLPLQGTGVVPYAALQAPASLALGSRELGTLLSQLVTITNTSDPALDTNLTLSNLRFENGAHFQVFRNTCENVAPGATCELGVSLTAPDAGEKLDTLRFDANTRTASYSIAVSGAYHLPEGNVPASEALAFRDIFGTALNLGYASEQMTVSADGVLNISFGNADLNTTVTRTVRLVNLTNAAVGSYSVFSGAAPFTVSHDCPATLPASGSCQITLAARPVSNGAASRTFAMGGANGAGLPPVNAAVFGQTRTVSLSNTSVAMGLLSRTVWSAYRSVNVTNTGNVSLSLTPVLSESPLSAETELTHNCGNVLPGGFCTVNFRVKPETNASFSGKITIEGSASSPVVSFSGQGSDVIADLSAGALHFGVLDSNETAVRSVTLQNKGQTAFTPGALSFVAGPSGNAPATAYAAVTNGCSGVSLAPNASCTLEFRFQPGWAASTAGQTLEVDAVAQFTVPGLTQALRIPLAGDVKTGRIALSQPVFAAGDLYPGDTITPFRVQVQNTGTGRAQLSSITGGIPAAPTQTNGARYTNSFAGGCQPGVTVLAPGEHCELEYALTAQAYTSAQYPFALPTSSTFTLTRNSAFNWMGAGHQATFQLTGRVLSSTLEIVPASLSFEETPEGFTSAPQTLTVTAKNGQYTLTNRVSGSTEFVIVSGAGTTCQPGAVLAKEQSCTVSVAFAPSLTTTASSATRTNVITFQSSTSTPSTVQAVVSGTAQRGMLTAEPLSMPELVPAWTYSELLTIEVTNTGAGKVTLTNQADRFVSDRFSWVLTAGQTNGCYLGNLVARVLEPGQRCNYYYRFMAPPTVSFDGETATGSLWFPSSLLNSSTATSNHQVSVVATQLAAKPVLSPATLDFGAVDAQSTTDRVITLTNEGDGRLSFVNIQGTSSPFLVAAPYTLANNTCSGVIDKNGTCSMTVRFSASGTSRTVTGTLQVRTAAQNNAVLSVPLTGEVQAASVTFPAAFDFGTVVAGKGPYEATHTLVNNGTGSLFIGSLALHAQSGTPLFPSQGDATLRAEFSGVAGATNGVKTTCGASLAPGASCDITVVWNPERNISLATSYPNLRLAFTANNNGSNTWVYVPVRGTSAGAELTVTPAPANLGIVEKAASHDGPSLVFTLRASAEGHVRLTAPSNPVPLVFNSAASNCPAVLLSGESCNWVFNINASTVAAPVTWTSQPLTVGTTAGGTRDAGGTLHNGIVRASLSAQFALPPSGFSAREYALSSQGGTLSLSASGLRAGATARLGSWVSRPLSETPSGAVVEFVFDGPAPAGQTGATLSLEVRNNEPYAASWVSTGISIAVSDQRTDESEQVHTKATLPYSANPAGILAANKGFDGNLYVLDGAHLYKYSPTGVLLATRTNYVNDFLVPTTVNLETRQLPTIMVDSEGAVWIARLSYRRDNNPTNYSQYRLQTVKYSVTGNAFVREFQGDASLNGPSGFDFAHYTATMSDNAIILSTRVLNSTSVSAIALRPQTGQLSNGVVLASGSSNLYVNINAAPGGPAYARAGTSGIFILALNGNTLTAQNLGSFNNNGLPVNADFSMGADGTFYATCGFALCRATWNGTGFSPVERLAGSTTLAGYVDGSRDAARFAQPNAGAAFAATSSFIMDAGASQIYYLDARNKALRVITK